MENWNPPHWLPILLLFTSNVFMTFAWYGHLRFKSAPLWQAILASWGIAFCEYLIMVPANRWGSTTWSPYQLKILQEIITLTVFVGFAFFYFGVRPRWNHLACLVCLAVAAALAFLPDSARK